jgi:chemotaxis protein CheX
MSSSSVEEKKAPKATQGIYGKLARAMVQSAQSVMSSMAGLEIKPGRAAMKHPGQTAGEVLGDTAFDISGIIGFAGEVGRGSFALNVTRGCALDLTASLFGVAKGEIDQEVRDTIGEFTNMIWGDARRRLGEDEIKFDTGLPTVVSGEGHHLNHASSGFCFVVPIESSKGAFALEASFRPE